MNTTLIASKNTVILKDAGPQKTKSGLIVPTTSEKSKPEIGIVLSIGSGKKPIEFKIGDKLVYRKYMDNKIFIGEEQFNFIDFKDIVGKIIE